jgi:hypothetical protein
LEDKYAQLKALRSFAVAKMAVLWKNLHWTYDGDVNGKAVN